MSGDLEGLTKLVVDLELERVGPVLEEMLEAGVEPETLLKAMSAGMVQVGEKFEIGEYFLADLVLAGELMKEGLKILEPRFKVEGLETKGTVVLCTVKGDVHDIGKNLVGNMLASSGFRVVDLGVDVHEDRVVEAVRKCIAAAGRGGGYILAPTNSHQTMSVDRLRWMLEAVERYGRYPLDLPEGPEGT